MIPSLLVHAAKGIGFAAVKIASMYWKMAKSAYMVAKEEREKGNLSIPSYSNVLGRFRDDDDRRETVGGIA